MTDWQETWQGRTAKLPDGGEARLSVRDGRVRATATWPDHRSGLQGDCGSPGKTAEAHWWAFVKFASAHAHRQRGMGKRNAPSRPTPSSPVRFRQQG